jgi:hypothetical protein
MIILIIQIEQIISLLAELCPIIAPEKPLIKEEVAEKVIVLETQ